MDVKEALGVLAGAAGVDLSEVRSIRYIGHTGTLDVSTTTRGTVRVEDKPEAPAKKTTPSKKD